MEDMVRAIEVNGIRPVVDKEVFTLDKAREAYEYMVSLPSSPSTDDILLTCCNAAQWDQKHFGKVAIKIE